MNDAVEMLYRNSYRLALSSEKTLKALGNISENKKEVEELKARIDRNVKKISKYRLSVGKKFEKIEDTKNDGHSSIIEYFEKIKMLEKGLNENEYGKIDNLEKWLDFLKYIKNELKRFYILEKLGNELLESDKLYKNTIFGYLKRIEKEERKIDNEKFLNECFDSKGSSFGFGGTSKGSSSFGSVGETSDSDSSGRVLPTLKIKADSSLKSCGSSNSNSPRLWFSKLCASRKQTVESPRKNATNIKGYF
ncbi:unnamed protein product [Meloidogyne enterolobii]|uniref:Uncharacterized protein n=1 Tax=Meloidogyne enterolobii TaxID=390850 RepID=A0ACB0YZK1_MELEN